MSRLCSDLLNNLSQNQDVNESKFVEYIEGIQDGFVLHEPSVFGSCLHLNSNPFGTFCLLPDPNNLLSSNMCNLLSQTDVPDSLFEKLVRGEIAHPDDLPSIWESANTPGALPITESWITVKNFNDQAHIPTSGSDYLGLAKINSGTITDLAVSNDCGCMHMTMKGGLYESQADGIVRPVQFIEDDKSVEPELISGNDDAVQSVLVNSTGRIRVALFSNKMYMYVNRAWMLFSSESVQTYFKAILWETEDQSIVYVAVALRRQNGRQCDLCIYKFSNSNNNIIDEKGLIAPVALYSKESPVNHTCTFGFLCASPIKTNADWVILWSTANVTAQSISFEGVSVHLLHLSSAGEFSEMLYNKWIVLDQKIVALSPVILIGATRTSSIVSAENINNTTVASVKASMFNQITMTCVFRFNSPLTEIRSSQNTSTLLKESLDRSTCMFVFNNALHVSIFDNHILNGIANQFPLKLNSQEPFFVFAIAPNGTDIWIFRQGILYRLTINEDKSFGSEWTTEFNLYNSTSAKCSDYGHPDLNSSIYNSGDSNWYLGTKTSSKGIRLVSDECVRSPHEIFRFVIAETSTRSLQNKIAFSHIANFALQRANEFALCNAGIVKLFDDSNVEIYENSDEIVWQSHTHDRVNLMRNSNEFFVNLKPGAISSPNGLYLLYVTKKNRLRLVFNAFNSLRFTLWCATNPELLGKAIDMQSNFCWNALKNPDPTSTLFADGRCTCIGGERLLKLIAPNAGSIPASVIGPLQENLPCLGKGCDPGINFLDTNVGIYYAQRCANRAFLFCDSILKIGKNSQILNGGIIQNTICLMNQDWCSDNNPCGPGLKCSNGKCLTSCANDQECAQMHGDSLIHRCIDGTCQPSLRPARSMQLPVIAIVGIIAAIILLILILLFFGLLARKLHTPRKAKS